MLASNRFLAADPRCMQSPEVCYRTADRSQLFISPIDGQHVVRSVLLWPNVTTEPAWMKTRYLALVACALTATACGRSTVEETGGLNTLTILNQPRIEQELMRLVRRDSNIFTEQERERLIRAYQAAVPEQVEAIIQDGLERGEIVAEDARLLSWEHLAIVEVVLRPYADSVLGKPEQIADFVISLFLDGVAKKEGV